MDLYKKEDRVFIKIFSREYSKEIIPISNQKYKDVGVMEKSIFDIT